MNDTQLHHRLRQYILAAAEHQRLDREHRANWRYKHIQEQIRIQRRQALHTTERAYTTLLNTITDLPEPTHLSRTARDLLQKWDNYRRNHAIMIAEYNRPNQLHTAESRNTFETTLRQTAEHLKTITTK